MLCSYFIP